MISAVGRFLLSAGEGGRSHREDTTIPTQWREGGKIPRPGRILREGRIPREGYQHITGRIPRYLHSGRKERGYLGREGYQHSVGREDTSPGMDTNTSEGGRIPREQYQGKDTKISEGGRIPRERYQGKETNTVERGRD